MLKKIVWGINTNCKKVIGEKLWVIDLTILKLLCVKS